MKFLEYNLRKDGYIVIKTNDANLPEVAYPSDKFKNFESLEKEILKKAAEVSTKKAKKDADLALIDKKIKDKIEKDK